jgi:integrase
MAGQLIFRGDDKWLLRAYAGRDAASGRRRYKSVTFRGSRAEARARLDQLVRDQREWRPTDAGMSVDAFLDQWLERVASNKYAYKTFQNYQYCLGHYVRPVIGLMPMAALSPADVQRVFTRMREKGVSSNTRRRIFSVLSSALDVAIEWSIIAQNPAAQVQIPRREKKEMRAMNREEAQRFLEVTDRGRWAEYFRTMLVTGMRPGESYALRREDIDFEHGVISIQRSLIWKGSPSEGWMLVEPKTERGRRQISIPRSLVEALQALRCRQDEVKRKAGGLYDDQGFVFANPRGRPLYHKRFIQDAFKVALIEAGLPRAIRLYDLRHTSATLLLKAGEHIKVVSERLGHASVSITLEVYVHVLPGMQEGAASRIDSLLQGVPKRGTPAAHREAHQPAEAGGGSSPKS